MTLENLRREIDLIDEQIVELLNRRIRAAMDIGSIKREQGKEIYAPEREKALLDRLVARNAGPIPAGTLRTIYREIMSAALSMEKELLIAFLGPEATFCHQAALLKFGGSLRYQPQASISEVFAEVEKRNADYGVVPIENSTEGVVTYTLDMFINSDLKICAELYLPIELHLMAARGARRPPLRVHSHPQVFGQCRQWLLRNLPAAERIEVSSTTRAAQRAAEDSDSAAIASHLAAEMYGLEIHEEKIQDSPHNMTRFLVVGRAAPGPTGADKTSILFSVRDHVGALYESLEPFMRSGLNMTRIESRPSKRKPWEYYFFVDFLGHASDQEVAGALSELERHCTFVKLLGSYPRGLLPDVTAPPLGGETEAGPLTAGV